MQLRRGQIFRFGLALCVVLLAAFCFKLYADTPMTQADYEHNPALMLECVPPCRGRVGVRCRRADAA